jgi:hypothetical protein
MADVKIPYTNRSYQQIKEYVLTRLFGLRDANGQFIQSGGLVPEVTDHTENSLLVRIVSLWAGLIEALNYYIDSAARETFLATCRRYRSAVLIARFYDYRVKCRASATCDVTFYIPSVQTTAILIPAYTILSTDDGIRFYTTQAATLAVGQTRITIPTKQASSIAFAQLAISSGKANQKYELSTNIAYNSLSVKVNGLAWASKDTFAFSSPTDRHFIETVNESGVPIVKFGDGYFGVIPQTGTTIESAYQTTYGALGNVSPYLVNTIVSTLVLPSGVTVTCANLNGAAGGTEVESLAELKRRVPLSNKTRLSAVTKQDYISITELHPSVQRAGVEAQCGADIKLYVVPSGGGVASTQTLSDVAAYAEDKKIIGRKVTVLPTGQVRVKLNIRLRVRADYDINAVYMAVKSRLSAYGSYLNQQIGGTVELNDIIAEIENTEGVVVSKIDGMTTVPFARPLGAVWQTLDWSVTTSPMSNDTVKWKIGFISTSRFQLSKNGNYVGTFNVGTSVVRSEVSFTVNAQYTEGSEFEFYTYPYFGTVVLSEMSLPVILEGDIALSTY